MNSFRYAAVCAALALPCAVAAQDPTYPGLVLRLPASVRSLGMGNVAVAGRDDDVLFYNPAQLVAARGTSVSAEQFSSTARTGAVSSVGRFNTGGIAVGATIASFNVSDGTYPLSDKTDLLDGGPYAGTSASLAVGVGQVFKRTRVGVTAKYLEERIGATRNTGAAFDVGLGRDVANYAIGLSVANIGSRLGPTPISGGLLARAPAPLPLRATLGASRGRGVGPFDLFATAAVSWLHTNFWSPAGGAELGYSWLDGYNIFFRAGARRPERGEGALTGGAGFSMDRLAIDYAIEALAGGRAGHRIGLRIR